MAMVKILTDGMLFKGALFGTGLLGVVLWRRDLLPKYMGIISIGAASFGLGSSLWYILTGKDKKESFNVDFGPLDSFYYEIASQVNEQLSQQNNSGELERRTVGESEEFDPIAFLRSGTKQSGVSDEQVISGHGSLLKNSAESSESKAPSKNETKPGECASDYNSELPIDEDDSLSSEMEMGVKIKRKPVVNLGSPKIRVPRASTSKSEDSKEQQCRDAKLFKKWETVYPEVEKEISDLKWTEKGLKLRKILGVGRSKTGKK